MTALPTKRADSQGRITLGKDYANTQFIIQRMEGGILQLIRAETVPQREAWLYKNPEALRAVMEGLEDAKAGRLSAGPDLEAGHKLAEAIED